MEIFNLISSLTYISFSANRKPGYRQVGPDKRYRPLVSGHGEGKNAAFPAFRWDGSKIESSHQKEDESGLRRLKKSKNQDVAGRQEVNEV